jgi:uncharacterized protein involved in outer membrane biogenesis
MKPFEGFSEIKPWPIEARLDLANLKMNIKSELIPATAAEHLELKAQLQGETLDTLAQFLDTDLPKIGPFQFSFNTQFSAGSCAISELEGAIKRAGPWQILRIDRGNASISENGSVSASLDTRLDKIPLSLTFKGGPRTLPETDKDDWLLMFEASASGATIRGDGAVVNTKKGKTLEIATQIKGDRLDSLGSLIGVSLPTTGKFNLSADVSSDGDVHQARNLQIQMRANRFTGSVRWEDKTPRPILTGNLLSKHLDLGEFKSSAEPLSKSKPVGLLDSPIKLGSLKAFDAKLDLTVNDVVDSAISVGDFRSSATLTNGELSIPFRANLAGAPVDGLIHLDGHKDVPVVTLEATIGKIDMGQTLKQLEMPVTVIGTADSAELKASSTGKTLRALSEQAAVTLRIKPASLSYTAEIANQKFDIEIESATLVARKDQQLTCAFSGTARGTAFKAEVSTANFLELRKAKTSLPLNAVIQTEDLQFKVEGSVNRPFENKEFELQYELTGSEIEELDPLIDFVVPLRGKFRARGRITGHGNRFMYEEDLRIGKSDLKADIKVLRNPPRPEITGRISASQIHMDDVVLFDVDKNAKPAQDKPRVVPDYTIPISALLSADLDLDIQADRIRTGLEDLEDLVIKTRLKDGLFKSSTNVGSFMGARISFEYDVNTDVKPPLIKIQLNAKDLNFGLLLSKMDITDFVEGKIDLLVDLSGSGTTRYGFLRNTIGRITIISGPGQITGRRIDLWAADLIPTMLSSRWQREDVTDMNCMVAHVALKEGQAVIEDLLLDTQRITVAASGVLNLDTEALDLLIVPKPKRASLVSLANPVTVKGTLAEPEVSAAKIPKKGQLASTGALAAIINPLFLIFAFSDTGTGEANPCESAVERAHKANRADLQ